MNRDELNEIATKAVTNEVGQTDIANPYIASAVLDAVLPLIEADIRAGAAAQALRDAADNVFMDETLTGRTAMVRTNEAWRLLLNTLANEYEAARGATQNGDSE